MFLDIHMNNPMNTDKELRPCPMCGSADLYVERGSYSSAFVQCNGCGTRGPDSDPENHDDVQADDIIESPGETAARRNWNKRRPSPDPKAQADAARYRWLREFEKHGYREPFVAVYEADRQLLTLTPDAVDRLVDAAMSKESKT